ncbi:hypothetical protein ACRAWG_28740 [Methylobacterium sp. P31]
MAEANMITGTHPRYWVPKASLLEHLKVFGVEAPIDDEHKGRMRHLIITKDAYTREQWRSTIATAARMWGCCARSFARSSRSTSGSARPGGSRCDLPRRVPEGVGHPGASVAGPAGGCGLDQGDF